MALDIFKGWLLEVPKLNFLFFVMDGFAKFFSRNIYFFLKRPLIGDKFNIEMLKEMIPNNSRNKFQLT